MGARLGDLSERLADVRDLDALGRCVHWLRDLYDVEHLVYHSVRSSGQQWGALTYDPEWVEAYVDNDWQKIDPVVQSCFNSVMPADWKSLDWSGRAARALLGDGMAHGLGNQGMSLPVRGPSGQFALFTVNGRSNDDSWGRFCASRMDELILAAHYINERATMLDGDAVAPSKALSPREIDALTQLALGRSRAQAADQLRISEHTLRVYIESARAKLGAQNTTHAVAHAMSRGMICL